jgi:hypothetical protein
MSTHFVPSRDKRAIRLEQFEKLLEEKLKELGIAKKYCKLLSDFLRPWLKLPEAPSKGATIMTEAAATNKDGKYIKPPESV